MTRIVVTGLGAVSPFGWRLEDLRAGLREGLSTIGRPRRFVTTGHRTRLAAEVPEPPAEIAARRPDWPRLALADRFAVVAAGDAIAAAGLAPPLGRAGLFFGGSTAGMAECEELVARLLGAAPGRPRIALAASQQINAPGDAAARALGITGPVATCSSACASGTLAIGAACDALRAGEVGLAVAGGSDALCQLTYAGFNALRSVDGAACRPFRADRAGLSLGEGAGALVLETAEHAAARRARPLAELLGAGASCDAHHMTAPDPSGAGAAAAIRAALADARLEPAAVDFVNTHGTATPHNDEAEAKALEAVFGTRTTRLPVTSVKGAIGHLLGSAGALEAVATVLALLDRAVQPTAGAEPADPALGVDLVVGAPRPLPPHAVGLSTSLAFGGANAAVVLATWRAEAV